MKCSKCNKKIIMIFYCKCGKQFCINCMHFFNHNCSFNYNDTQKQILSKTNIKVESSKVDLI